MSNGDKVVAALNRLERRVSDAERWQRDLDDSLRGAGADDVGGKLKEHEESLDLLFEVLGLSGEDVGEMREKMAERDEDEDDISLDDVVAWLRS